MYSPTRPGWNLDPISEGDRGLYHFDARNHLPVMIFQCRGDDELFIRSVIADCTATGPTRKDCAVASCGFRLDASMAAFWTNLTVHTKPDMVSVDPDV